MKRINDSLVTDMTEVDRTEVDRTDASTAGKIRSMKNDLHVGKSDGAGQVSGSSIKGMNENRMNDTING